jgi:ubiquinone/menaquinone biosynthesis C-methylase UbiE
MPNRERLYLSDPGIYDRLIDHEDFQQNLHRRLNQICSFRGRHVADLGAGTGRIARMVAPVADHVLLTDKSEAMLRYASDKLRSLGCLNYTVCNCDIGTIPCDDSTLDVVVAAWTLSSAVTRSENWRPILTQVLGEIGRVLKPGGIVVIIETLGTGAQYPRPPTDRLAAYYSELDRLGFCHSWIRTDYLFASVAEKEEVLTSFFELDELIDWEAAAGALTFPECTGIWWFKKSSGRGMLARQRHSSR